MLTKKQKRNNWILTVVLLIVSLLFLFPVIWMLANSFKPDAAITADMNSMAAFIPPALNGNFFENYVSVLTNTGFVRYMCNTLFYAAILIVLGVIVNGLAGYALAKINFPFRERWLLIIMLLDDRTDGDDHYDTFPDHCKTWTSEYGAWICTSNDRESV